MTFEGVFVGGKYIDWSGWKNFSRSDFTNEQASHKITYMLHTYYEKNIPRTIELFVNMLDTMT